MRSGRTETWRFMVVLAVFSAVALMGGGGEIARAAPSPDAHLRQGIALYNQGRYAQAVEAFRKAIQADPRFSRAYAWLGLAYVKLNQPRPALEAFRKVVEIVPNSEDARVARQWIKRLEAQLMMFSE
mgnify:CR=1 FL=1